jgi:hypothetical protein
MVSLAVEERVRAFPSAVIGSLSVALASPVRGAVLVVPAVFVCRSC